MMKVLSMQDISTMGCIFLLDRIKGECAEIQEIGNLFQRKLDGDNPTDEEWNKKIGYLDQALDRALDQALALDLEQALDLALGRDLDQDLGRALDLALEQALDLGLALVEYLITLLGDRVPQFKNLDGKISNDISLNGFSLNMSTWHTCETTHCMAGFCEFYAGEKGKELVKYFDHWLTGAMIYFKSTGRIPDFYASDEDALKYLEEHSA